MNELPDNIVDANNILFLSILGGADDCGTGLHPGVATELVHYPIVVRQNLAFVHYWNKKKNPVSIN